MKSPKEFIRDLRCLWFHKVKEQEDVDYLECLYCQREVQREGLVGTYISAAEEEDRNHI